jgi:hypothetical protein
MGLVRPFEALMVSRGWFASSFWGAHTETADEMSDLPENEVGLA